MTVLAFSVARFTPADLDEFHAIALPRLEKGLWAGVARQSGRDFDRIVITLPGVDRAVFSFERDRHGMYALYFHDRGGSHRIGAGYTAAESLAVWRLRARVDGRDRETGGD